MREAAWVIVMIFGGMGLALLLVSMGSGAIQQAAVGSMVTAFMACVTGIAYAATAYRRQMAEHRRERAAAIAAKREAQS